MPLPMQTSPQVARGRGFAISLFVTYLSLVAVTAIAPGGTTIYVATCGDDSWTGATPDCAAPDGPKRHIQAAIDTATHGDQIVVAEGSYNELIDFTGKAISLQSEKGAKTTTIDGSGLHGTVVTCQSGEGSTTELSGFTVTRGAGRLDDFHRHGGGMYNLGASPSVSHCVFTKNTVSALKYSGSSGGGVHNVDSNPTFTDCEFSENSVGATEAEGDGGGMLNERSNPIVSNCSFIGNVVLDRGRGGGMLNWESSPTITNSIFARNAITGGHWGYGGGIANSLGCSPRITNCTFSENSIDASVEHGGAIYNDRASAVVANCIFWADEPNEREGGGFFGAANFFSDPHFVDATSDDYRLKSDSPAIDAGTNAALASGRDKDGTCRVKDGDNDGAPVVDAGAYETAGDVLDCDRDQICDTFAQPKSDCNGNLIDDVCDIASGISKDLDHDGIPDECESVHNSTQDTYWSRIQLALDNAIDGDEIVVSRESSAEAIDFHGKAVYLRSVAGPASTIINASSWYRPVVTCASGEGRDTILDGFSIVGGAGRFDGGGFVGGGMYNEGSSPTVRNCIFDHNGIDSEDDEPTFGGEGAGMYNFGSAPSVSNCTFNKNFLTGRNILSPAGAGMYNDTSDPMITDCTFSNNVADDGDGVGWAGAMYNIDSSPIIEGCVFSANFAGSAGGALYNWSGNVEMSACSFTKNKAGGEYGSGGAIYDRIASLTAANCVFTDNFSPSGGAMSHSKGDLRLDGCRFEGNRAGGEFGGGGGAAGVSGATAELRRCTFVNNSASSQNFDRAKAGALSISAGTVIDCTFVGNSMSYSGGGALVASNGANVFNCLFVGNKASHAGALWATGDATIRNCVLSSNDGGGMEATNGDVRVANSIVWRNTRRDELAGSFASVTYSDVGGGYAGDGNINADPLFVRIPDPGPDKTWGTEDDDYGDLHLESDSPCIDAGDPNYAAAPGETDLDHHLRIWDGNADGVAIVDMGAYEFGSFAYGDLNCDSAVNFDDIDAFVAALTDRAGYEQTYPACNYLLADTNADGAVDFSDIDGFVDCLINHGCQ